jgi:hypothetical protein
MPEKVSPLYGSFDFGEEITLEQLLERLETISVHFLNLQLFNSYLRTIGEGSHYGLSNEEVRELVVGKEGKIKTLSISGSGEGIGVNVNIRFAKDRDQGIGHFVIAAGTQKENQEIRDMLMGIWEPPEEVPEPEISALDEEKENAEVSHPAEESPQAYPEVIHKFFFRHDLKEAQLVDCLFDLFINYLDEATFEVRMLTWSGDLYLDIPVEGVREKLKKLHGKLQKLFLYLNTEEGKSLSLSLSFSPLAPEPDSELKLQLPAPEEVLEYVKQYLSLEEEEARERLQPQKQEFYFQPARFQVEPLLELIGKIQAESLHNAQASAFLSSQGGVVYHDVGLEQLKDLFYLYQKSISILSIFLNRPLTGQNLSLVFEFKKGTGTLSHLTGRPALDEHLKQLTFEGLKLSFSPETLSEGEANGRDLAEASHQGMKVFPVFESKLNPSPEKLGLLILPQQAAWRDLLSQEVGQALSHLGLEFEVADSIFGYLVVEKLWQQLHASEVIVADLSGRSAEVFYPLGIAHTLGRKIVLLTQEAAEIPFDFKKYHHIIYEANEAGFLHLRQELLAYLKKD